MNMEAVSALVLTILSVESSYLQEVERPATKVPDTVQFWFTPNSLWRIRTYAIDHDIHTHTIGTRPGGLRMTIDEAVSNTSKHYGDVIVTTVVLRFSDLDNPEEIRPVLATHKLPGKLEIGKNGVVFYNPDNGQYRTLSKPQ